MSHIVKLTRLILAAGLLLLALPPLGPAAVLAGPASGSALLSSALAGHLSLEDAAVRTELARLAPQLSRQERQRLEDVYYHQIIAANTDLEAFARIAELAALLAGSDVDGFMLDVSRVALNATGNWQAFFAGAWGRLKQAIHARVTWFPGYPALGRFGASGFAADDGGNQVQHFWYSVATAYRYGATFADLAARYHEWNPTGLLRLLPGTGQGRGTGLDLGLSRQGIVLGRALANGSVKPAQVGGWLRANLGRQAWRAPVARPKIS